MAFWRVFPRLWPVAMDTNKRSLASELSSLKSTSRSDSSVSTRRIPLISRLDFLFPLSDFFYPVLFVSSENDGEFLKLLGLYLSLIPKTTNV